LPISRPTAAVTITSLLQGLSTARLRALFSQDSRQAAGWVRVAAEDGSETAQLCYGRMLLAGTGVEPDAVAALRWFRRAAARGDIDAVNMVGRCFDNGWGTVQDPASAAGHYRAAADAGHAWARYNLGHLHLNGRGVPHDPRLAQAYYRLAANQGHERAMNLVGRCCEHGWGTPVDMPQAELWYRRSAEAGYFRGQYNWATVLLEAGQEDEAAVWFARAAAGGTPAVREAVQRARRTGRCAVASPQNDLRTVNSSTRPSGST
jgi:TPR repeat protein